jgi:hypothetical protein
MELNTTAQLDELSVSIKAGISRKDFLKRLFDRCTDHLIWTENLPNRHGLHSAEIASKVEWRFLGKEERGRSALLFEPKIRSAIASFRLRRGGGAPDYAGNHRLMGGRRKRFHMCCGGGIWKIGALLADGSERSIESRGSLRAHHAMMLAVFATASRQAGFG